MSRVKTQITLAKYGASGSWLMEVDIDTSEIEDLIEKMSKPEEFVNAMDEKVGEIASETADEIASLSPVDTGHLQSTLRSGESIERESVGVWVMQNKTPYGIRQNFEHRTKAGFMTNPINRTAHIFPSEMMKIVEEWLD